MFNNNNENNELNAIDILSVISIIAQFMQMAEDEKGAAYIDKIIKIIANEIKLLHQENKEIINKLDLILERLNGTHE